MSDWEKKAMELFYKAKEAFPHLYSPNEYWYNAPACERSYWFNYVWFLG